MSKGRHLKESSTRRRVVLIAGAATAGAIPLSLMGATSASAATLGPAQIASYAHQGCPSLSAAQINVAVKIAMAESMGNTNAHNSNGEDSRGLWQINVAAHGEKFGNLYDPLSNAKAMCSVSGGGAHWGPWTTYAGGKYLSQRGYLGPLNSAHPVVKPRPNTPSAPKPKAAGNYTVVSGDTLYGIAKAHGFGAGNDNWHALYNLNRATVGSDPDVIKPGQNLRIPLHGAPAKPAPHKVTPHTASYVKPVNAARGLPFGVKGPYTLGYHTGQDFRAASGTPVVAVTKGVVVASDTSSAYGNNVQIKTQDGHYLLYAHLSSKSVSVGQNVTAGQRVGLSGSTGHSSGPHLHFEVRTAPVFAAGNFLNPVTYLISHGVSV